MQNRSGHDVFYRAEDGLTGLNTRLPDGYYLDAPIDGVATFKSISTDKVYKIPTGGRISVMSGGEIFSETAFTAYCPSLPGTRYQYGWLRREFFTTRGFYEGDGGWGRLFDLIPFIR